MRSEARPARRLAGALAFFGLAAVGLQGCALPVFSTTSYWDDLKSETRVAVETSENHAVHFLGIRVSDEVTAFQTGVKVIHVFGSSPAARAGLEAGDEVRAILTRTGDPLAPPGNEKDKEKDKERDKGNRITIRSADELRKALEAHGGMSHETVQVVYVRSGQEQRTSVDLIHFPAYVEERRRRMFLEAAYGETEFPFFFNHKTHRLTPEWVFTYFGVKVDEAVLVDEDYELFPIIPGISVFRRETVDLYDGSRHTLVTWPFRITTGSDDRTGDLHELIPARPEHTVDL